MTVYRIESYTSLFNINITGYYRKEIRHDNQPIFALFFFKKLEEVLIQQNANREKFICRFEINDTLYTICEDLTIPLLDVNYLNLNEYPSEQKIIEPSNIQVLNLDNEWISLRDFICRREN